MLQAGDSQIEWVLRLVEAGIDGQARSFNAALLMPLTGGAEFRGKPAAFDQVAVSVYVIRAQFRLLGVLAGRHNRDCPRCAAPPNGTPWRRTPDQPTTSQEP
jgi:hypothetical protein